MCECVDARSRLCACASVRCVLRVACCVVTSSLLIGYATRIALPAGSLTKIFRSAATSFVKAGLLESPSTSVSSPVRSKCVLETGAGGRWLIASVFVVVRSRVLKTEEHDRCESG